MIDASDVHLVSGFNWFALVLKNTVYAMSKGEKPERRNILMHRIIMRTPSDMVTDHIDSDGLNNRRVNLRLATRAQNNRNKRIQSRNTSGFKGVTWHKDRGKWRADIMLNGGAKFLGHFNDPELAHLAYCEASTKLHGEFARFS